MDDHTMTNENLEHAMHYAQAGLPVFPCRIRDEGEKKAKSPYTQNGFHSASTNAEQINCWWANHPDAMIGMPTGKISGLVVIDIDPRHGGDHSLQGLIDQYGSLPETLTAITGGGGTHYYFRYPDREIRCSNSKLASGVDVKADGGYVIMPPSGHESGKSYFWDGDFDLNAVAEIPQWLLELIDTVTQKKTPASSADGNDIRENNRNNALASLAGTMRSRGMGQEEVLVAILTTNRLRCKPPLPESEVEAIAKSICRYEPDQAAVIAVEGAPDTDISAITAQIQEEDEPEYTAASDPGPMPLELLRIPGFVSEVMDFCLENAPTRNHAMAFCGALALQSVLGARKVRDPGDNRSNLYLVALAPTGGGKDTPREINSKLLEQIGMQRSLASRFGSGESIEDKLAETPVVLCQTDEFDGILLQMKNSTDGRTEAMLDRFKEVFTSSNKTMYTRCLAGKESKPIYQPSLTIFGSAVPVHYYSALSEKMLTDGFFSRTIAVEAPLKIEDQEPTIIDELPDRISETAAWWSQFNPTPGNLTNINPRPAIVPMSDEAKEIIAEVRKYARQIQNDANDKNDVVTAAVWSRVRQMTRKLALIYAISKNCRDPTIDTAAITWARDFIFHQARRMLFMANDHVSENPFHGQCLKVIKFLRNAPKQTLSRGVLLGKMKCKAKELDEILLTLFEQGRIRPKEIRTKTKPAAGWELVF